eukprot:EG_transcript_6230
MAAILWAAEFGGGFQAGGSLTRALLPHRDGTTLDFWFGQAATEFGVANVSVVCDAAEFKHFERWASAAGVPAACLVNTGSSTRATAVGPLRAVERVVRTRRLTGPVAVIGLHWAPADHLSISQLWERFHCCGGELVVVPEPSPGVAGGAGLEVEVEPSTGKLLAVCAESADTQGCPLFLCLRAATVPRVREFLQAQPHEGYNGFLRSLLQCSTVFTVPVELHVPAGLAAPAPPLAAEACTRRAYARVGIMGNPSDGFFGRTIAMTIGNFWAEATLAPSERLRIVPHPLHDQMSFGSLGDLHHISSKEGYAGGVRLLQATCKRFAELCRQVGVETRGRNFTLSYDTNIPRQVGLAGSSAIITAVTRCLLAFYGLTAAHLPRELMPNFVLSVENEELGIAGGLQDRVAQVYEGLLYMDFDRQLLDSRKYGNYERLDLKYAPPLWLAFCPDPSDSGRIHSDVRERWRRGDPEVVAGMAALAALTEEARAVLVAQDWRRFASLMDRNFDLRRGMFGDACLGQANLEMVTLGRQHGAAVKFPGSGGAVIGLCPDGAAQFTAVREALEAAGYVVVPVLPQGPSEP